MTLIHSSALIANTADSLSHRRDEAEDTKRNTKTAISSFDHAGGTLTGSLELDDLTRDGRSRRRQSQQHLLLPQSRRASHRPDNDDDDAMKFSHSIQFNAVPDWSTHYIAYSNLKKLYVELG